MKTQNEVRRAFFESHEQAAQEYKPSKSHNQYSADTRTAFSFFIDGLRKDEVIKESLANRVRIGRVYVNGENIAYNHYKEELNKINTHGLYSPKFQFKDEDGATKWLNLNQESAREIVKFLKRNFHHL